MICVEEVCFMTSWFTKPIYLLLLVSCLPLDEPSNGIMNCSLGDDNITSYEDTCNFTCNTGYELTGSDTRTCQSDGNWSGNDNNCIRGKFKFIHA